MAQNSESLTNSRGRFNAFGGVFTPCTLTIFGVIMFLRFGEVVGNAGIINALVIVSLGKLITVITSLSLSANATNIKVKGGGAYYLISRSLGLEFGGAIGLVFFMSQAVAVALYVIGFTEALISVVPLLAGVPKITASVVNIAVFVCVFVGAGWTIKVQYGILAIMLLAVLSFVIGSYLKWDPVLFEANSGPLYETGQSFWTMFALFFPAVTGVMAGANMSGDLKNPARAIPLGTLSAVFFTGFVYLLVCVLLGGSSTREELQGSLMVVADKSILPFLVIMGVFAATLSSALGSMMGAPRVLQAIGKDKSVPILNLFAKGSGTDLEPRRAIVLTFIISQAGIVLGDLNAIAPVITMFFLITYGGINLATFLEAYSGNPSYRPTFRWCHWSVSLIGAVFCAGVMLLINVMWALAAIIIMILIYKYLQRRQLKASWGDVAHGSFFENARRSLLRLEAQAYHHRNWRPFVMALGTGSGYRLTLAALGRRLAGPTGLLMLGQVLQGQGEEMLERHSKVQNAMRKLIADNDLDAFPATIFADDLNQGVSALMQTAGIGSMRPNMALFGWNDDSDAKAVFEENIRTVVRLGKSVVISRELSRKDDSLQMGPGTFDIWWQGRGSNGNLMLLLGHILCRNEGLRGRRIRLIKMVPSDTGKEETVEHLENLCCDVRIPCEVVVAVGTDFREAVSRESAKAALVLIGMQNPCEQESGGLERLASLAGDLEHVLFVYSAGDMDLRA